MLEIVADAASPGSTGRTTETELAWLTRFHAGDRATLGQCYREHFAAVARTVEGVVGGPDRDTVIHDVFVKLIADAHARRGFKGGSFVAWIARVAHNAAIDHTRKYGREQCIDPAEALRLKGGQSDRLEAKTHARRLIERFRREHLKPEWEPVFVARFLEQRTQRDAALRCGIHRTTLAFRELQIRRRLRRFLLEIEA